MGVMLMGSSCDRCHRIEPRKSWPIREPYCINCMHQIREIERKSKWHYPPNYVEDESAWMSACNEVAQITKEKAPFQ